MKKLYLFLSKIEIGVLEMDYSGRMSFTYSDDSPIRISFSMPIRSNKYSHKQVLPFFQGLLPDNESTINALANRFGVSRNPFSLLSKIGADCAGAIRILTSREEGLSNNGVLEILSKQDVETALRQSISASHGNIPQDVPTGSFSLAGAQAKIALFKHNNSWYRPSGAMPTTHILKPTNLHDGYSENEHFCMELAKSLGLPTPKTEVVHFGNMTSICVKRYDRMLLNDKKWDKVDGWQRIHQEDFCQVFSIMPNKKYQNQGGPSSFDISNALNSFSSNKEKDVKVFAKSLFFNWLIGGSDAHGKNLSIIHLSNKGRLAPLYDITSARPYPHIYTPSLPLSMKIGENYASNKIKLSDWISTWNKMGVNSEEVYQDCVDMINNLPDAISDVVFNLHDNNIRHNIVSVLEKEIQKDLTFKKKQFLKHDTKKQFKA